MQKPDMQGCSAHYELAAKEAQVEGVTDDPSKSVER